MVRLAMVTFDATDARSLATWWSERFGEASTDGDEDFLTVTAPDLPLTLGFQRIDQARSQRNTVHLDLIRADHPARVGGSGGKPFLRR
jgi:hypothetical protein